jgi:hypothetical protein
LTSTSVLLKGLLSIVTCGELGNNQRIDRRCFRNYHRPDGRCPAHADRLDSVVPAAATADMQLMRRAA